MPTVTIGFTARESYSLGAEALRRLFAHTHVSFHLIVVDANTPERYRREMMDVLAGRDNVEILRVDHFLMPGASKNLVVSHARTDYVCMVENDVLVHDGWLQILLDACEQHPADVAVPVLLEGMPGSRNVHFDTQMGHVKEHHDATGTRLEILPRGGDKQQDRGKPRHRVEFFELHCVLYRRSAFEKVRYEEEMNNRSEIDMSLQVRRAGLTAVLEPRCEVNFVPPYPPRADELEFFCQRWSLDRARKSRELLQRKWNLTTVPGSIYFVEDRLRWAALHQVAPRLQALVGGDQPIVLIDDGQWSGLGLVDGLKTLPFLERNGVSWGMPSDDRQAIAEISRMREAGAALAVFAWPSFWWLKHYAGFGEHLRKQYRCVVDDDVMLAFDLRAAAA